MRSRLSKHVKGIKGAEDIYEVVVGPICDPFFTYRPGIVQSLSRCSYTVNIKLTGRLQRNSSSLVKFEQQQRVRISSEVFWESLFVFLRVFFFMGTEGNVEERMTTSEYLAQLLKDKKQLQSFPNAFVHLERILDDEIRRVRGNVFCISGAESLHLPEPLGPVVTLCEKIIIPTREFPEFNFIGRLLGPRGMTAKQLELDTGCKILVRGQGSMRDKQKEEQMKGKPKWEHLNEELHVLITVEDSRNRATVKLRKAVDEVKKLLVPVPECDDELKKRQLIELAILNGTYRGLNGINGIFVSTAANGTQPLGSNFLGTHMAIGPSFSFGPHEVVMGPHFAMGPTMLPLKSSPDQAGAPILLTSPPPPTPHHNPLHHPPMTMYAGSLTPLPSPGPVTPIQSPGGMAQPLLLPCSEGGLIYHFNPCIVPPHHTSQAYEYPLSPIQPPSFGLSVGH